MPTNSYLLIGLCVIVGGYGVKKKKKKICQNVDVCASYLLG